MSALALRSVIQLRGYALTYLAGGPAIPILTALLATASTVAFEPLTRRRNRPLLVGAIQ